MTIEPGDMFQFISYSANSTDESIFVIVEANDDKDDVWITYNLTHERYEWDRTKIFLSPKHYRRLV